MHHIIGNYHLLLSLVLIYMFDDGISMVFKYSASCVSQITCIYISAHIKNYRKYERRIAGIALLKNIVTEFLLIIQKKQKYVFKL